MANGPRSIYSRRQRLGPARYDNPLADFLENLPAYFNDYQRNQLALERQQLADKRYEDSQRIAREQRIKEENRYQNLLKQQAYRNELTLINSLPEPARAKAMLSSENEDIQEAGRAVEEESNAFDSMLNPSGVSESDSQQLDYYNNLLNNPSVRNNQARINQVKGRIKSVTNNLLKSQVEEWYESNKDNPNAKIILQQSQHDPSGAIKNITTLKDPKKREIITDASGYKRYVDTGERVFPDVVKEPPLTGQIKGLTSILSKLDRDLRFFRSSMSPEEVLEKEREITAITDRIKALTLEESKAGDLTIPPPGSIVTGKPQIPI